MGAAESRIREGAERVSQASATLTPIPTPTPPPVDAPPTGDQVVAIGDSVMLAVAPELQAAYPGIFIDATVSRQMTSAPAIVQDLVDRHVMRPYLLLGLGTNGSFDPALLQRVQAIAGPRTRIVLVNVQAPRGWTPGNNEQLAAYAARKRNVDVANWHDAIAPRLDLLAADQIHAGGPTGGGIYVQAVTEAFLRLAAQPQTSAPNFHDGERPGTR
jgi:hypothetical protein